jgi:hypothetical protein
MAIVRTVFKGVSHTLGEVAVVGLALGTAWACGFVKGSNLKSEVRGFCNRIEKDLKETMKNTESKEPAAEHEAESERGTTAPPIKVSSNDQPED